MPERKINYAFSHTFIYQARAVSRYSGDKGAFDLSCNCTAYQLMTANVPIHIIGGGLAGSEAAWQVAQMGIKVILHEMRPVKGTGVHATDDLAELVCSNSFRSDDAQNNAVGLLHMELRHARSLIMQTADVHQVPAGGALAVDRKKFSRAITKSISTHTLIQIERGEIAELPPADWSNVIIATGPLTSPSLAEAIQNISDEKYLAFFDATAPIVYRDMIDFDIVWFQSRYDKQGPGGTGADYINCPMDRGQYENFVSELISSDTVSFKDFEKNTPYFDGCLPIEEIAARGINTLRYGPMKSVGLTNPHKPQEKAYAIVQLRQDNNLGTLYNMVGFQTKLKHAEQTRIFRTIPGLQQARFARLGGMHRNTFLNSPHLLDKSLRLKRDPRLRFAGQITGCEGYVESTAIGLIAGYMAAMAHLGQDLPPPPETSATGALLRYITGEHVETNDKHGRSFQPMNINFGLFPPIELQPDQKLHGKMKSIQRRQKITARALTDFDQWLSSIPRQTRDTPLIDAENA